MKALAAAALILVAIASAWAARSTEPAASANRWLVTTVTLVPGPKGLVPVSVSVLIVASEAECDSVMIHAERAARIAGALVGFACEELKPVPRIPMPGEKPA